MFVFQFVSLSSHAGKTAVIVQLIRLFKDKGLRVGVIKHSHSYDLAFDLKSAEDAKDTVRFVEAGSDVTVAVTDNVMVAITHSAGLERALDTILGFADVVFVEGFRGEERYPRVVVAKELGDVAPLLTKNTIAITGGVTVSRYRELAALYPSIAIARSAEELASVLHSYIVEKFAKIVGGKNCGVCGYRSCEELVRELKLGKAKLSACPWAFPRVSVHLDGKPLPLNPFVQSIIEKTVRGMLSALKGVGKPSKIEIFISSPPE
ncbi:MAG: molybdopterin-guanine dinucleotide biosynthesis protein B [Candidatus Jordarchaeales archaeon]